MKKTKLLIAPLLVVPLMASCGGSNPDPKPEEYTVGSDTNGLTISVTKAYKGQEFKAELGINTTQITEDLYFPETLSQLNSGNKTLGATEYTYTRKDDNKKADLIIPAENVLGNIDINLTFVPPVLTVTKEEFDNAIAFKDVKFMQANSKSIIARGTQTIEMISLKEFSDTVFHVNNKRVGTQVNSDKFCENANGKYYEYTLDSTEEPPVYIKEKAKLGAESFITPEFISFSTSLDSLNITYADFKYDENKKIYAYTDPNDSTITLNFGFKNKKLISYDGVVFDSHSLEVVGTETDSFEYKQTTPELPKNVIEIMQIRVGNHDYDGLNTIRLTHDELPASVQAFDIYDNPINDFNLTSSDGENIIDITELTENHKIALYDSTDVESHTVHVTCASEGYMSFNFTVEVNTEIEQ